MSVLRGVEIQDRLPSAYQVWSLPVRRRRRAMTGAGRCPSSYSAGRYSTRHAPGSWVSDCRPGSDHIERAADDVRQHEGNRAELVRRPAPAALPLISDRCLRTALSSLIVAPLASSKRVVACRSDQRQGRRQRLEQCLPPPESRQITRSPCPVFAPAQAVPRRRRAPACVGTGCPASRSSMRRVGAP